MRLDAACYGGDWPKERALATPAERGEFCAALVEAARPVPADTAWNERRGMFRNQAVQSRWVGWCLAKGLRP